MMHFEKLIVWNKAIDYAETLVKIADLLPQRYQFSFSDQLRRAALSIPNNIAEGAGRTTPRDRANFYSIAKGSVYETVNILKLAERLTIVKDYNFQNLYYLAEEISKMLYGLSH